MSNEYSEDAEKTWRFTAILPEFPTKNLHWDNPVLIYSGSALVGAAFLALEAGVVTARASVLYGLPERLDAESGVGIYLLPKVRVDIDPFDETVILSLELRRDCDDNNVAPIRVNNE